MFFKRREINSFDVTDERNSGAKKREEREREESAFEAAVYL